MHMLQPQQFKIGDIIDSRNIIFSHLLGMGRGADYNLTQGIHYLKKNEQ